MARITMRKVQETKLSEVFTLYLASAAARGVKDKTLRTYEQHFNAISKRLDVDSNISLITSKHLDKMILRMREDGLSDSSINSYTRTLKVFFSWCNEQGYTKTNLKIYKAFLHHGAVLTIRIGRPLACPFTTCRWCLDSIRPRRSANGRTGLRSRLLTI